MRPRSRTWCRRPAGGERRLRRKTAPGAVVQRASPSRPRNPLRFPHPAAALRAGLPARIRVPAPFVQAESGTCRSRPDGRDIRGSRSLTGRSWTRRRPNARAARVDTRTPRLRRKDRRQSLQRPHRSPPWTAAQTLGGETPRHYRMSTRVRFRTSKPLGRVGCPRQTFRGVVEFLLILEMTKPLRDLRCSLPWRSSRRSRTFSLTSTRAAPACCCRASSAAWRPCS
jgi:hypothetical protein